MGLESHLKGYDPRPGLSYPGQRSAGFYNLDQGLPSNSFSCSPLVSTSTSPLPCKEHGVEGQTSCVIRETSQGDCAFARFFVWAAVKRNTYQHISSSEKLQCPLFRCRKQFDNLERMLDHLTSCQYGPTCEYFCYDHFRVERFDDAKCTSCISHPSRKAKMKKLAKSFFGKLGRRRLGGSNAIPDEEERLLAPPSYHESQASIIEHPSKPELSCAAEILEMDSHEVVPKNDESAATHEGYLASEMECLPMQSSMEWQPTPITSRPGSLSSCAFPTAYESLSAAKTVSPFSVAPASAPQQPHPVSRGASASTRSSHLSPSSSVRSTNSTNSDMSNVSGFTNASTLCSGASNTWSDTLPSSLEPINSSDYPEIGFLSDICPRPSSDPLQHIPELPADETFIEQTYGSFGPQLVPSVPLGPDPAAQSGNFAHDTTDVAPKTGHCTELEGDAGPEIGRPAEAPECPTMTLVTTAWDALQAHLSASREKVAGMNSILAGQFTMMASQDVAQRGLASLRSVLDRIPPKKPLDLLCLLHVVYSFSLVVFKEDVMQRSGELFAQSMLYALYLPSGDKDQFHQIADAIWRPQDLDRRRLPCLQKRQSRSLHKTFRNEGEAPNIPAPRRIAVEDPLLAVAQHFLEELEITAVLGSSWDPYVPLLRDRLTREQAVGSDQPASCPVRTQRLINVLDKVIEQFHDKAALVERLNYVNRDIRSGNVDSPRRFELSALRAGQETIAPRVYDDRFAPLVRKLCDPIYELEGTPGYSQSSRQKHYALAINMTETRMMELAAVPEDSIMPALDALPDAGLTGHLPPSAVLRDSPENSSKCDFQNEVVGRSDNLDPNWMPGDDLLSLFAENSDDSITPAKAGSHEPPLSNEELFPPLETTPDPSVASTSTPASCSQQTPAPQPQQLQSESKSEADASCRLCGYRPKGDPRWFHGSMSKHMKVKHREDPPIIYKCNFPGCNSKYSNRPDNLRQHQLEKGHFLPGESREPKRPMKRKKIDS